MPICVGSCLATGRLPPETTVRGLAECPSLDEGQGDSAPFSCLAFPHVGIYNLHVAALFGGVFALQQQPRVEVTVSKQTPIGAIGPGLLSERGMVALAGARGGLHPTGSSSTQQLYRNSKPQYLYRWMFDQGFRLVCNATRGMDMYGYDTQWFRKRLWGNHFLDDPSPSRAQDFQNIW